MFKTEHKRILNTFTGLTCLLMLFSVNASAEDKGKTTYDTACVMCHKGGVMGAPKLGNKSDWDSRIAKGKDVLYKNAINGFKGSKGVMPPKGGNAKLSDQDVKAAVDYLISNVK